MDEQVDLGRGAWRTLAAAAALLAVFSSSGCFVTAGMWIWAMQPVEPHSAAGDRAVERRGDGPRTSSRRVPGSPSRSRGPFSKPKTPEARRKRLVLAAALTPLTVACDIAIIAAIRDGDIDLSGFSGFDGSGLGGGSGSRRKARRDEIRLRSKARPGGNTPGGLW